MVCSGCLPDAELPMTKADSAASPHLIFVVDDDQQLRPVLVACLERAGFHVVSFPDAESALAAVRDGSAAPKILVSDYQMPGMNGLRLIAHLREMIPQLRTVSISGTAELPELALPECRPDQLLAKPFLPSELIAVIHELMPR
jgi:CheY-like chemotaxis protein